VREELPGSIRTNHKEPIQLLLKRESRVTLLRYHVLRLRLKCGMYGYVDTNNHTHGANRQYPETA
jgi:hypothetical protein